MLGVSFTVVNVYFVVNTADAGALCQLYSGNVYFVVDTADVGARCQLYITAVSCCSDTEAACSWVTSCTNQGQSSKISMVPSE